MGQLIAFRAVQGIGAGGLMVGAMAIIGDLVPPRERGRYQGMMAAVMPIAFIGGPLLGGYLTDNLSWRWAFYINIPLGIAALIVTWYTMNLPQVRREARIDWKGAGLLGTAISALTLLTSWGGNTFAWGSWQIIGLAVLTVVAGALFIRVERRVPEPILSLDLFRNRSFIGRDDPVLPHRLRDVRRRDLPAAVPADRPGRVGHEQRAAAPAADGRHAHDVADRRPDRVPHRSLPLAARGWGRGDDRRTDPALHDGRRHLARSRRRCSWWCSGSAWAC